MVIESAWTKINEKFVERILALLNTKASGDEVMLQKVSYIVKVLLSELEKIILLIILFAALHRLTDFLIAFLTLGFLRIFIGGSHRKTMLGCFLFSFISFGLIVLAADRLLIPDVFRFAVYAAMLVVIRICAPIPSPQRVAYSAEQKTALRYRAVTVLAAIGLLGRILSEQTENLMAWAVTFQLFEAVWCKYGQVKQRRGIVPQLQWGFLRRRHRNGGEQVDTELERENEPVSE